MLNFRLIRIISILAILFILFSGYLGWFSFYWIGLPICFFITLTAWGAASIQSGFYVPVHNRQPLAKDTIAITFDDGPHPEVTPALLEVLKKHGVEAAFFCIGRNLSSNEHIVRRLYEEGHCVGNHTFSHRSTTPFYNGARLAEDIGKNTEALRQIIGARPLLFRPPFGVTSPPYAVALRKLGLKVVGWSIRSLDTVIRDPDRLARRIRRKNYHGEVFLFHDTNWSIVSFIDEFLSRMKMDGINVVRVDKLFNIQAYEE